MQCSEDGVEVGGGTVTSKDVPLVLCSSDFHHRRARTRPSKAQGLGKAFSCPSLGHDA